MSKGRADVPIRVGSGVVQIDIERTAIHGSVVRIPAPVGETETGRALYPYVSKKQTITYLHTGEKGLPRPLSGKWFQ